MIMCSNRQLKRAHAASHLPPRTRSASIWACSSCQSGQFCNHTIQFCGLTTSTGQREAGLCSWLPETLPSREWRHIPSANICSRRATRRHAGWQNRVGLIDLRGNAPAIVAVAYESNVGVLIQILMYSSRHDFIIRHRKLGVDRQPHTMKLGFRNGVLAWASRAVRAVRSRGRPGASQSSGHLPEKFSRPEVWLGAGGF